MIHEISKEAKLPANLVDCALNVIEVELHTNAFLLTFLKEKGVLQESTLITDPEYRVAAFKFWNDLIDKLEAKGK